jgi:hypothetical protein
MRDVASLVSLIVLIVAALAARARPTGCARRAALPLGAERRHHQLAGGEFASSLRAENIKISRRRESHRMTSTRMGDWPIT